MNRRVWFVLGLAVGVLLLVCGFFMPAHLRAVNASVLDRAGRNTPTLVQSGVQLAEGGNTDAARLLLKVAQAENLPDHDELAAALARFSGSATNTPRANRPGLFTVRPGSEPFTVFAIRSDHRRQLLEFLQASPHADVRALLRFRAATNLMIFSPSSSSSGQALDTAITVCGLLLEDGRFTDGFSEELRALATEATLGRGSEPFEQALLDLMSLGQRFNWDQLTVFVEQINDSATLARLTSVVRNGDEQAPLLFAAVHLSGNPSGVAEYLSRFSQSGLKDLQSGLRFNRGGVNELLRRGERLHVSRMQQHLAEEYCLRQPQAALMVKWFCYLAGGFFLGAALPLARPLPRRERSAPARGLNVARSILFALGCVAVVLLLSEPFLAQENQKAPPSLKLRLPTLGNAAAPSAVAAKASTFMNQSLLTLLLFFVIQALIYTGCRFKLSEIRTQQLPPRIKLKLLDNEDHLFDAGLYIGFAGTIISLIFVSMGVVQQSLMAAYSSTSFGIIFVSVFKIFNLRPVRRTLLLEAEGDSIETARPAPAPNYPLPS